MRYLLQNVFSNEIPYRMNFLFHCFHLYFKRFPPGRDNFIEFVSLPPSTLDCLMIYGHNRDVNQYLLQTHIPEKNIVIITCEKGVRISNLTNQNHTIFLSKQIGDGFSLLLDGNTYNMNFNPTKSELLLYNTSRDMDILSRLNKSFDLIQS